MLGSYQFLGAYLTASCYLYYGKKYTGNVNSNALSVILRGLIIWISTTADYPLGKLPIIKVRASSFLKSRSAYTAVLPAATASPYCCFASSFSLILASIILSSIFTLNLLTTVDFSSGNSKVHSIGYESPLLEQVSCTLRRACPASRTPSILT